MVHALGGMRGPARTFDAFAREIAHSWDVSAMVPSGFLADSLGDVTGVDLQRLPAARSRPLAWARGASTILGFVSRDGRPDVIHANGLSALNLAAPAALRWRLPMLVHFHESETGRRQRALLKTWRILGLRPSFAPVSAFAKEILMSTGSADRMLGTLPNPITSYAGSGTLSRRPGTACVGYVGDAKPRKGLHLLAEIAVLMRNEDVAWHLYGVSGREDGYVDAVRSRIREAGLEDRVEWHGTVTSTAQAYRGMDVLLVPSLRESFCRVALEGMASGVPVVASRIPGMTEVVGLASNEYQFDPNDPKEAVVMLRRLLSDGSEYEDVAARGIEVARRFEAARVVQTLVRYYEATLAANARPAASCRSRSRC
jgi:glycosyltransferase involved in cell wall biosynthesis